MSRFFAAGVIALMACNPAQAQNAYYWPAPAHADSPQGLRYYLPVGTPLQLRTLTQISTKDNKPGDRVYLEVAENIYYRGQVIIPVGSPAVAEVAATQRNGHFGKKGKIEIRLIEVQTPNGPVRLDGRAADEGKSGTAASVATIMFVSVLGFLIHGTSATIPPGTPVQGQLANDMKFTWYPNSAEQSARADNAGTSGVNFNF